MKEICHSKVGNEGVLPKIHFSAVRNWLLLAMSFAFASPSFGFSTIEINEAVLPATTGGTNTFTAISFASPFEPGTIPNVFPMTTEDGDDPCTIRIQNVTHLGFEAACLEPSNEDGNHPGMMLEYIAVVDGGVTVPLEGGGGSVEFRSECISTTIQQYGNQCNNCSGTRDYVGVPFSPNFAATPAFIAQIQTTENTLASGDPSFLDVAIQSGSLDETGVNIAIEQMEAGLGPLGDPERICYLAVERNGCESLDFSSLGGNSTPVPFNAVLGGNVDGHNNNCSSGEGANFTAGCFTGSTPIAVAGKNSRNGGDGGMLRRCSVNDSEIILTFDEDQISNNERSHVDELVSVFAFGGAVTTPVTLSQAQVELFGRKAFFEWQTSAESFHLGFHLWGELDGHWVQLNKRLITNSALNGNGVKDYQHQLRLSREQRDNITQFGISSLDNSGFEEFYGPFSQGLEYGEEASIEPIDWTTARAKFNLSMTNQGYHLINGRWKKASQRAIDRAIDTHLGIDQSVIRFTIVEPGIHQLSFSDLIGHAPHWQDVAISEIALSLKGEPLPRHIDSEDSIFNHGDTLTFVGILPRAGDETYLDNYRYQLQLDNEKAIPADSHTVFHPTQPISGTGYKTKQLTQEREYSALLTTGNPWYDSKLVSIGNAVSKVIGFELPSDVSLAHSARLNLNVFGAIDFPSDENESPDHVVQVRVNGQLLEELSFDGFSAINRSIQVPAGTLVAGSNSLTITLPGTTGYEADIILIDEIRVSTAHHLSLDHALDFSELPNAEAYEVEVTDTNHQLLEVFAYRTDGALAAIQNLEIVSGTSENSTALHFGALPQLDTSNPNSEIRYSVAENSNWHKPVDLELSSQQNLHTDTAEYLVVSHPAFINSDLNSFVDKKVNTGMEVTVIDWLELVNTYGFGNNVPQALENYLTNYVGETTRFVLLVGGHTFDYRNLVGSNSVNFIPAPYRQVNIFGHTPTDNPYADLDGDNKPDLAIGRWPVRSADDLKVIIKKTHDWENNVRQSQYQDALLLAQANDSLGLDFDKQALGRSALPMGQLTYIDQVNLLSMQELINAGVEDPVGQARQTINQSINDGLGILSYSGHASTSAWGSPGIVNTNFIQGLQNNGKPIIVMPQACYTTYYESPNVNTLAHQWLFAGDIGAVAIHGASVLGEYRENGVFAERFFRHSQGNARIGEAIMDAKGELSENSEMLFNWALLGDPSLPLH